MTTITSVAPRIVLHFHPGWGFGDGRVLDAIATAGIYRTQWQTGTSNGGLTAHPGGDQWRWESKIFAGQYDDAGAADRPVYGAWNRRNDPHAASPRFGSAYLRLRPDVVDRATFCWPDSVYDPQAVGGPQRLEELCRVADAGILDPSVRPDFAAHLPFDDPLNDYVEALVLDPRSTPGIALRQTGIDPNYRSHVPVELARTLGGEITPAKLAAASRSGDHDHQAIKWLWHRLARFDRQM